MRYKEKKLRGFHSNARALCSPRVFVFVFLCVGGGFQLVLVWVCVLLCGFTVVTRQSKKRRRDDSNEETAH